jgi:hypothetical protein
MKKTVATLAAVATAATAVPAVVAIPQAANAQVSVAVGTPGAYFVFNGRHYRHRRWRNNSWYYYDPVVVAAPNYYYYGGRRYYHRGMRCHWNRHYGRVCRYRYW